VKRVLKWDVPVDDREHTIGAGFIAHVGCQQGPETVQVWTEQSDDHPTRWPARTVRVFGTGQPLPDGARHLGSVVSAGGALVWHVYEVQP
jgi:hypothetical protein